MSNAKPMGWNQRERNYMRLPGGLMRNRLTPRQARRLWHKEARAANEPMQVFADAPFKGVPTPRQRKPVRRG